MRPSTAAIAVNRLIDGEFQRRERSEVLPALDLAELAYQAMLRAR